MVALETIKLKALLHIQKFTEDGMKIHIAGLAYHREAGDRYDDGGGGEKLYIRQAVK